MAPRSPSPDSPASLASPESPDSRPDETYYEQAHSPPLDSPPCQDHQQDDSPPDSPPVEEPESPPPDDDDPRQEEYERYKDASIAVGPAKQHYKALQKYRKQHEQDTDLSVGGRRQLYNEEAEALQEYRDRHAEVADLRSQWDHNWSERSGHQDRIRGHREQYDHLGEDAEDAERYRDVIELGHAYGRARLRGYN